MQFEGENQNKPHKKNLIKIKFNKKHKKIQTKKNLQLKLIKMKYTIKYFIFFINNSEMKLIKLKRKKKKQPTRKLIIIVIILMTDDDDHER